MTIPRPAGITCPDWQPTEANPAGKRCRSYQDGGTCWLDDRFVCSEWAKHNAGVAPTGPRRLPVAPPPPLPPPPPVDASGGPDAGFVLVPPPLATQEAAKGPAAAARARAAYEARLPGGRHVTVTDPEPFTAAKEIDPKSLDALAALADRIELDAGPLGRIALVRERTAEDDLPGAPIALTLQEAATLRLLVDSFPGARVVAIRRKGDLE